MSMKDKTIKVTLEFKEDDLNTILAAAAFGDDPLTVDDVIKANRWKELENEFKTSASSFVFEIVDGSEEACANDWLVTFGPS